MQHLNLFYLFVTTLIGIVSLGIVTTDYLKTRDRLLRTYLYYLLSLTLLVVSELIFSYASLNLPDLHPFILDALEYLNVFVAQYALMVTFPFFIHAFFDVPQAPKRNRVFIALAVIFGMTELVFESLIQIETQSIVADGLDNLVLMLVFFYGFVTGISEYKHCEPEKASLAKRFLILLGIFMPAIIVDTLLHDTFPVLLYPLTYCAFSISFTYHLAQYSLAHSLAGKSSSQTEPDSNNVTETDAEPASEKGTESFLTEQLYQQYNISPREQDVLPLVLRGFSNNQIAEALFISLSTVKAHLRNIYAKVEVKNRYELVAFLKHGDDALIPRIDAEDRD